MGKYVCLNPISPFGLELFREGYDKVETLEEADAVLVRSASMHDTKIPENINAIARAGAGVNNIPIDQCSEDGIVVFNTPGANANGVKELVVAGLMLASRDIIGGVNWVKDNQDDPNLSKSVEKAKKQFAGNEVSGKKLGVLGLGAIGVLVANIGLRLGMKVYGYDPYISVDNAWDLSRHITHVTSLDELYSECDYITVHVPLADNTKEMINKESINRMKDGVKILNFSRDLLVCDDDMVEALKAGKVAKYITDFPNDKIAKVENVIGIPHLGASTEESEDNCATMAVKQVIDYLENGNIINSVNYPACNGGRCQPGKRITINHKNIPSMLTQFTSIFSSENINISNLINKSKGDYAYTLIDIDGAYSDTVIEKLCQISGVLRVRTL